MKKAFTLIELLMVVALIAIVSTLAVMKVGGMREAAARKVSLASQRSVERAVETFLTNQGRLNRLDSLIYAGEGGAPVLGTTPGDFDFTAAFSLEGHDGFYMGPFDAAEDVREERNLGLTPGLQKVLCPYTLNAVQVTALVNRLGLKYVMAHTAYADAGDNEYPSMHYPNNRSYGDGTVPNASDGLDPNSSACVATKVVTNMMVAAVNPMTDLGRTIYQACGQELMNTKGWGESYNETEVRAEVAATGGPLIAFGLGDSASIVGKADGGLESAPYATYPLRKYYSRYILLFRLKRAGAGSVMQTIPEFAGVIDPCGNTIRAAESIIKTL
ncbi:MAG: type II secretion system GspH family protein [Kiritimatiellae bacterium]|nr:type II secretion system GspH family protein [Kiritimatiellia bacterium]